MKLLALALVFAGLGQPADPPPPIIALFRTAAEALAEPDAGLFLEQFDSAMPGYAQLQADIEGLLIYGYVVSTIEFASDQGDGQARDVQIDWLWRQSGSPQHRALVKCRLERKGRAWKITRLEPAGFFRR